MPINTFKCPNCGSPVTTTGAEKEVQCAYCGSTVIVPEELREAPQPQPQPMQYNFGPTSQPNDQAFQGMVTADKVAKAAIGFTAASFILPIILTCVILAAVGGILFYVFSNVNSTLQQSNQTASTVSAPINEVPTATPAQPTLSHGSHSNAGSFYRRRFSQMTLQIHPADGTSTTIQTIRLNIKMVTTMF